MEANSKSYLAQIGISEGDGAPVLKSSPTPIVGVAAVNGAMWTFVFSILHKVVLGASQIALAWYLTPADFGLAAVALSVTSFSWSVGGANLKTLLLQRSEEFASMVGQVFWISLTVNIAAAVVLICIAPLSGELTHQPRVTPLIVLAACATVVQSIPTVYAAALSRDLRFRRIAVIHFGASVFQYGSALILASMGFGAYALVAPLLVVSVFLSVAYRLASGRLAIGPPRPGTWVGVVGPAGWLMTYAVFLAAQSFGTNIVIGVTGCDAATAGYYYWGAAVSAHVVHLMAANFQGILLPSMTKLKTDEDRLNRAARQSCRFLCMVLVPVGVLQFLNARPLMSVLFHDRWLPSASVMEWLSLGMVSQPLSLVAASWLMAKGQYRRLAGFAFMTSSVVLTASAVGARIGDEAVIAGLTSVALFSANIVTGIIVFRGANAGIARIWDTFGSFFLIGVGTVVLGSVVAGWSSRFGTVFQIGFGSLAAMMFYTAGLLLLCPDQLRDFLHRITSCILRKSQSPVLNPESSVN